MSSSLEERLKTNSSAFDGLLSLIPAKYYYDDDTQNQWKAKKKTKEEARDAKRAKLDPSLTNESEKSGTAADVLKKRAKTAKPVVLPGNKIIQRQAAEEDDDIEDVDIEDVEDESNEDQSEDTLEPEEPVSNKPVQNGKKGEKEQKKPVKSKADDEDEEEEEIDFVFDDDGNEINLKLSQNQEQQKLHGTNKLKELTEEERSKKEEAAGQLREKLASKISALKEKRKAIGSKAAGAPSSREAILEERRKKAEIKALQKKRKLEEEEEDSDEDDDESEIEDIIDDGMSADNVLYQNIKFNDQERTTSDLQNLRKQSKKKGPAKKDIKAHLKLIEAKKQKFAELDDSKQRDLATKEQWNTVIAQAEGEKLRNDERLLKKALKRKDAQKRKSEFEWKERKETVQNSISAKEKRREENLQIRKNNKGIKRKNQAKQKRKFKGSIAPKRAGFEGRRSRK